MGGNAEYNFTERSPICDCWSFLAKLFDSLTCRVPPNEEVEDEKYSGNDNKVTRCEQNAVKDIL